MARFLTGPNLRKSVAASLILAAAACLILWIARIFYAISFVTPWLAVTTGGEEETLFSIWKFIQYQAVYADPHRIPFAVSNYNWGFYCFYGWVTGACLHVLHLDPIWIATVGRLVTVVLTLLCGAIFYRALRDFVPAGLFARPAARWAWCAIATCSPLVGFWSITVRPDLGALAFECAGLYAILRYVNKPSGRTIAAAVILFYLAWAFKQSQVTMLAGSVLSLLLLKRWRALLLLGGIWWLLAIVTLILGGPIYRESVLFSQGRLPWAVHLGIDNICLALVRNLFLPFGLAASLWMVFRRAHRARFTPVATVLSASLLFSFCFAVVTAFKLGAVTNYYIPAAWIAMLALAVHWEQLYSRWTMAGLAACSFVMVLGIARTHVAYGEYHYADSVHRVEAEKFRSLPAPVFATDPYANLPWVQYSSPHFVVAGTYFFEEAAGTVFEDGGWEGLARSGYFGTVVTNEDDDLPAASLQRYELTSEYKDGQSDLKFYRRMGSANR